MIVDRNKFLDLLRSRRTREEIEQMWRNALNKGETELAGLAKQHLHERYPPKKPRTGGATPTLASFREEEKWFPTAKEAYVWLIGRFIEDKPDILESEEWKTDFVAKGRAVNYFAQDLKSLFLHSPHLADDPNMYSRLGRGWFVDLNLSNDQKFDILTRFSAVAEYKFREDWNWRVEGRKKQDGNDSLLNF